MAPLLAEELISALCSRNRWAASMAKTAARLVGAIEPDGGDAGLLVLVGRAVVGSNVLFRVAEEATLFVGTAVDKVIGEVGRTADVLAEEGCLAVGG